MNTKTPHNTKPVEIVDLRASGVLERVEPSQKGYSTLEISEILNNRRSFAKNHKLHERAMDVLMSLCKEWIMNKRGLTIYALCDGVRSHTTPMRIMVYGMIGKGLVEAIGDGERAKLYAPTSECLRLMRKYFNLRDCA